MKRLSDWNSEDRSRPGEAGEVSNLSDPPLAVTIEGRRAAPGVSRREAMRWVLASLAAGSVPALPGDLLAQATKPAAGPAAGQSPPSVAGQNPSPQEQAAKLPPPDPSAGGYGTDPVLTKFYKPGAFWPLTFTPAQKQCAKSLADTIIPRDDLGPAASEVGVVEMLDEWVSAPYPRQQADRPRVLAILEWVDAESAKRFGKPFAEVMQDQRHAICDDVCYAKSAKKEFKQSAESFDLFRSLSAGAYYATPEGWKAIGYVGNVALPSFDGPPPEVLARLGVEQTVK